MPSPMVPIQTGKFWCVVSRSAQAYLSGQSSGPQRRNSPGRPVIRPVDRPSLHGFRPIRTARSPPDSDLALPARILDRDGAPAALERRICDLNLGAEETTVDGCSRGWERLGERRRATIRTRKKQLVRRALIIRPGRSHHQSNSGRRPSGGVCPRWSGLRNDRLRPNVR